MAPEAAVYLLGLFILDSLAALAAICFCNVPAAA
jgi:hypothetical protein